MDVFYADFWAVLLYHFMVCKTNYNEQDFDNFAEEALVRNSLSFLQIFLNLAPQGSLVNLSASRLLLVTSFAEKSFEKSSDQIN